MSIKFDKGDFELYRSKFKSKLLPAVVPGTSTFTKKQATGMPRKKFSKVKKPEAGIIKKGLKVASRAALSPLSLGLTGAYALGASSRRFKKAPKVGEGRRLSSEVLSKPDKRTYYL